MAKHPENPCGVDCARRGAGCAVGCKEWAQYVEARNAFYDELRKIKDEMNAARDLAIKRKIIRIKEGLE